MNSFIKKLNFKKVVIAYIIIVIIVAIALCLWIGNIVKDKISFVYNYHSISKQFKENGYNDYLQEKLRNTANNLDDIIDILVLDNNNQILYSAKNSVYANQKEFSLVLENNTNRYYSNSLDDNTLFKLTSSKELSINTILSNFDEEIELDYYDTVFFESELNNKNVYLLSYTINKDTGNKIYFISESTPVQNGSTYIKIAVSMIVFFFMLYWVIIALYVYQNALKSKLNPYLWGGITLHTNIVGLIIYFIYKQNNKVCSKCGAVQSRNNIYCICCGTKLNETCIECGAVIDKKATYCGKCGKKQ